MSGTIKVLSYNTSWESSEPKPKWNEDINFYEERGEVATAIASEADYFDFDEKGNLTKRTEQPDFQSKRAYTNKMLATRDKEGEFGDGEDGISFHANKNPEEVRTNIFSIIKSGNYDLVGMQEYVHKIYDKNNYGEAIQDVYAQKQYIPSLTNMKLVIGHVPLNLPKGQKKTIEIGSLYNKNKFEQVGKAHYFDLGPDGRPVLIVLLNEKSSDSHILFINAHMPQGYNIKGEGKPDEIIANKIDREIEKMNNQDLIQGARIILTTDSNDANNKWIRNIKIMGKKLNGGSNYKPTCCTTLIRKKNGRTREERRIRFGDIILDSQANENSFAYDYPKEIEGKAYSDHAPISAKLPPTQHNPPAPVSQGLKHPLSPQEKKEDNATSSGLFAGWFGGKKKRRKRKRTRKKKKKSRRRKRGGKKSRKKKRKRKTRKKKKRRS
tara:strand:- start:10506 stop:11816 length:1311 start_codon:yes stop_codon:yes gene_type:complete